jgi:hypothetical protein
VVPYACIGKDNVNAPLILCNLLVEPVKVFQVGNIPLTAAIFFPIFATAALSPFSRLPVMYTCAPSLTTCIAVVNPISPSPARSQARQAALTEQRSGSRMADSGWPLEMSPVKGFQRRF